MILILDSSGYRTRRLFLFPNFVWEPVLPETPFRSATRNRVSRTCVPKQSLGTRRAAGRTGERERIPAAMGPAGFRSAPSNLTDPGGPFKAFTPRLMSTQ